MLLPKRDESNVVDFSVHIHSLTDEGSGHLQTTRWNIADGGLDIVRDPFDEVRRVLVLNVEHLFVDLLHRHAASEDGSDGEISAVSRIARSHHVLGIEHLLGEFGHGERTVLLRATRCQWSEARHEEVQTWEWHHVHGQLAKVGIELTWKAKAGGDTRHRRRDEVIQIAVGRRCQFQRTKANIVQSFVVDTVGFICILDQLMNGQGRVVRFNDGVRHFR